MKKAVSFLMSVIIMLSCLSAGVLVSADEVIKVACIGDSITEGSQSSNKATRSYPAHLQEILGTDAYEVKNFGLSGKAVLSGKDRSYDVTTQYTEGLAYKADIVIFMLGTNDVNYYNATHFNDGNDNFDEAAFNAQFKADMKTLINSYKAVSGTVYIANTPTSFRSTDENNKLAAIAELQAEVATELGCELIDVRTFTSSMENGTHYADGLHPNDTGYCLLAQYFYTEIFGGELYDMTVKGAEGATCSAYGQSYVLDETEEVTFKIHAGEHNISLKKAGYDRLNLTVNVPEDNVADFSDMDFVSNLALTATAFDQGVHEYYDSTRGPDKLNDGDASSSWQLKGGDYYSGGVLTGIYVGFEFAESTSFNRVVISWELGSRCTEDGYYLEYSDDGENWTKIAYTNSLIDNAEDTLSFDAVTAKYLRLVMTKGSNSKYTPRLFEIEVYGDNLPDTTPDDPYATIQFDSEAMTAIGIIDETPVGNLGFEVKDKNGDTLADSDIVYTGCVLTYEGEDYTIIILGDTSCDGYINSTDFMQVRKQFLETYSMNDIQKIAADVDFDGNINSTDFMRIKRYFLSIPVEPVY